MALADLAKLKAETPHPTTGTQVLTLPSQEEEPSLIIPSSYAKLGATRTWVPTRAQRLRFWITSYPGYGKTSWVMSNPKALVFDFEDSCRDVIRPKATRITCRSWSEFLNVKRDLCADGAGSPAAPWLHISLDTMDRALDKAIIHLTNQWNENPLHSRKVEDIREIGKGGKGVAYVRDHILSQLYDLYEAGYGWTVTGHLTRITDDNETRTVPLMWPSLAGAILRESQVMGFLTRRPHTTYHRREIGGRDVPAGTSVGWEHVLQLDIPVPTKKDPNPAGRLKSAETKTRYKEHLPNNIALPQFHQFSTFEAYWNKALEEAEASVPKTESPAEPEPTSEKPSPKKRKSRRVTKATKKKEPTPTPTPETTGETEEGEPVEPSA